MKITKYIIFFFLSFYAFCLAENEIPEGMKKRIAVINFEDRSGYGNNIGTGLADMLVTSLMETNNFIVVERSEIEQVISEQGLALTGLANIESAAEIGGLLGVEIIVTGSVTEFGEKEKKIGGRLGKFNGFKLGVSKREARTAVDVRLVNVATGEIILAKTASSSEQTTGLDDIGFKDIDFHNTDTWDKTLLGKASRKAVRKCVSYISQAMKKIPWQGKIIKVNEDGTVYIKPGSEGGVKIGMELIVYRVIEELYDPDTGIRLGADESKIGTIQVVDHVADGKAAKAIIKGGLDFQIGDLLRLE